MVIGPKKLLELVKKQKLVENLSERELQNPEGAGFDIRIDEVYKLRGKAHLEVEDRKTPDVVLFKKFDSKKKEVLELQPGDYFLIKTVETVNLPEDITAHIFARSTLYRSGILFLATQVSPGYCGKLVFGLTNLGPIQVEIELGSRIAHIQFLKVEGGGSSYRGQWQGGRVTSKRKEKQV